MLGPAAPGPVPERKVGIGMRHAVVAGLLLLFATAVPAREARVSPDFLWGAASAAYQVEGAPEADGKGPSVWDVWLNRDQLAGPGVNGNTAIDFHDRTRYLADIALLRGLGIRAYRFSVSWPRIIPGGTGAVNRAGVEHYRQFVRDLRAAGIEPMLTLYHWDLPWALHERGGWNARESVEWFADYADAIFANFGDLVTRYVLLNEPAIETGFTIGNEARVAGRDPGPHFVPPAERDLGRYLREGNHKLLAAAAAAGRFRARSIPGGEFGLALPLSPSVPADPDSAADRAAAAIVDGLVNRWFLDPLYRGRFPADVADYARARGIDTGVRPGDAERIGRAAPTFLGVNYYAPGFNRHDPAASDFYGVADVVPPGTDVAYNGPNRPDQLAALLDRIRTEYGNPPVHVTENGAGFPGDDVLRDGRVEDARRCGYVVAHVAAMREAMARGADVRGYFLWSSHDNLEWLSGYERRFGMIHVDFGTQARTPKRSAHAYAALIRGGGEAPPDACAP